MAPVEVIEIDCGRAGVLEPLDSDKRTGHVCAHSVLERQRVG